MSFSSLNDMLDRIIGLIGEKFGNDIDAMRQLPPRQKAHPLGKITVAVGAKGCSLSPVCIGNKLTSNLSGRKLCAEIEVTAYVPLTMDSKLAYSTIDSVTRALADDARFGITGYEHGVLSANRATGSFELHCVLKSTLYETEE